MSDASVFAQINEPGVFGPLGPQANPAAPEVNPTSAEEDLLAPPEESTVSGDIVEFSGEALRLAGADEDGLNAEEATANTTEAETNAFENDTTAGAASTAAGAVETEEPTTTGIPAEEPETGDLGIPPEEFNEDLAQERLTAANAANPEAARGTVESGIGATIEPETEPTAGALETEPEPAVERPNDLETQANELFQFNTVFAVSNGLPTESPAAENAQAPENTQNQQQVILNELSSQLAQAVPPATILSVVG